MRKRVSLSRSEVAHLRVGNSTDFNIGGLELARTHTTQQQAIRVLEHASRIANRVVSNSTSTTTAGRLARELEDYIKRLKRIEQNGPPEEFFRVLRNAQMKLMNLVIKLLR